MILSPIAAIFGGLVGLGLRDRQIGLRLAAALVALTVGLAECVLVALNGGLIDESGSASSLLFVAALGSLAGAAAVATLVAARRIVVLERRNKPPTRPGQDSPTLKMWNRTRMSSR